MLCSDSEAQTCAKLLISGYPNSAISEPEYYIAQLVAVFVQFDRDLVRKAVAPSGIPYESPKFMPTIGEVNKWLTDRAAQKKSYGEVWREGALKQIGESIEYERRQKENRKLTLQELKDKYGDGKGGWLGTGRAKTEEETKKAALESAAKVAKEFAGLKLSEEALRVISEPLKVSGVDGLED